MKPRELLRLDLIGKLIQLSAVFTPCLSTLIMCR